MKLLKDFYQVAGPGLSHSYDATAYLIGTEEGAYLIDCGTPEGYEKIKENIKQTGYEGKIIAIYATHGHYDHVGAAHLFQKEYKTQLYIHEADSEQVLKGDDIKTTAKLLYGKRFIPANVTGFIKDGDIFEIGEVKMEAMHTPGHTMGSVSFALSTPDLEILVAGDTLWGGFSEYIGSDEKFWCKSLDKITARHFDLYTFGHITAQLLADADVRLKEAKKSFATYYNPWFKAQKDDFRY